MRSAVTSEPDLRFGVGHVAVKLVAGLVLIFLIAPIAIVIPISFSAATYVRFPPPGVSLQW